MASLNRQIILDRLPQGPLTADVFRLAESQMPAPGEGEVLLRTLYVSIDAAARAWMLGPTYRAALNAGDLMAGVALAEVIESRAPGLKKGDLVFAETGWQEYAAVPAKGLTVLPRVEPLSHLVSVYGVPGLTAYFGLLKCGLPKSGETVAISAAAGAVGIFVGQIARLKGCRTVGIAGGPEKCGLLTRELGFDAAVDYKAAGNDARAIHAALHAQAPDGVDIYFDNTGGPVMDACLFSMRPFGRIVCCGAVSNYDGRPPYRAMGVPGMIVTRRLTLKGFIVSDFNDERAAAIDELWGWVEAGKIAVREDVVEGFENLPDALIGLLAGENVGKRMVKVA
jgi:NADPH-dependent curcumin reductase CurA